MGSRFHTGPELAGVAFALATACAFAAGCRSCRGGPDAEVRPDQAGVLQAAPCVPLPVVPPTDAGGASVAAAAFVVTGLRFGATAEGLDLDCVATPEGCRNETCREGPEDGPGGVDNRLGPLALRLTKVSGTDLQAEMTRAVEAGRHPLLLRIVGATGFDRGSAEAVEISFGRGEDGEGVRPDPGAPPGRPSRFAPVAIEDGVLVAGPTRDWMPLFWTRGQVAAVPVEAAWLRLRLAEAPRGDPPLGGRITEGLLAGAIEPGALAEAILDMDARTARVLTRLGPVVRALVRSQADLDLVPPGATARGCEDDRGCRAGERCRAGRCHESEGRFDALSFAIRFEAASVQPLAPEAQGP